jgi:hypothetical protein
MSVRLLPSFISSNVKSNAEKRVFQAFRNLSSSHSYQVIHSLNLPEHIYKARGEIDFLVLSTAGIFVLEVKGGRVSCKDGIWYYTDRYDHPHKSSEGPFNQAQSAMYSLEKRLKAELGESTISGLVFGFGIIFPDCNYDVDTIEWSQEIVLDARGWLDTGLETYLQNLARYWYSRQSKKNSHITADLVRSIAHKIRPDFELVQSLRVEAEEVDARLSTLTEEQYSRLDIIESNPRILIEGAAGTGKTMLALETANRLAENGKSVLFVCFSPILAAFLSSRVVLSRITVKSIHQVMLDTVNRYSRIPDGYYPRLPLTDPWFARTLAPEFERIIKRSDQHDRYDALIVDEGQDILNLDYLSTLGHILNGGLEKGIWRIFYDPSNQGAIYGAMDANVIELLDSLGAVHAQLSINCRNTDQIILQTKLVTGTDIGVRSSGPGPEVIYRKYKNPDQAIELLEVHLRNLREQEIPMTDITVLSPLPLEHSSVWRLSKYWRKKLYRLDEPENWKFPFKGLTFATVQEFKGLENRFVIVTDIEDVDSSSLSKAFIYVAMTRPRVALCLFIHEAIYNYLKDLGLKNMNRIRGN